MATEKCYVVLRYASTTMSAPPIIVEAVFLDKSRAEEVCQRWWKDYHGYIEESYLNK